MSQNVAARSTRPTGAVHDRRRDAGRGRGPPHQRQPHQPVDVVRALEQQPEVALELAVVGGEDDVDVVGPAPRVDGGQHPAEGLVDELALDGVAGVDLAHLVGGQGGRHPVGGRLVVGHQRAVVPEPPVAGLGVEDALALGGRLG